MEPEPAGTLAVRTRFDLP